MVFRLPTHLESFVPPPSEQVPQSRPWQGVLSVPSMRSSDRGAIQQLRVTAVETDGDNRVDLWPSQFFLHPTQGRTLLADVQAWIRRHAPPLCTFIPDRLHDSHANSHNQANFRSLSRVLFESQMVAIAPWNAPDRLPGDGIIIFPAQNSSAILVGAIFLTSPFPEFIVAPPSFLTSTHISHTPPGNAPYQQPISAAMAYSSTSRHALPHSASSSYRQGQYSISPDQLTSDLRQPRTGTAYPAPAGPSWPVVKDEEDADLSQFTSTLRGSHGQT